MKDTKGITLIMLIIIVIILIILSGVTIGSLTNREGTLRSAQNSVDKTNNLIGVGEDIIGSITNQIISGETPGGEGNSTPATQSENKVYASLYKISNDEYHLIFNSTGNLAKGYTQSQWVGTSGDISGGCGNQQIEGVSVSDQFWGEFSDKIKKCKIEEEINPTSTEKYFVGLSKITEIEGIKNINTSNVTNMNSMFYGCSSLTSLDVSKFNTANVTNMYHMFRFCSNLTTIYAGDGWSTSAVTDSTDMFTGSPKLVGGAGTTCDANHIDGEYARVDGGESAPGYFTYKAKDLSEYQNLKYIESSGQFIITNYYPRPNTKIEIKLRRTTATNHSCPYGCDNSSGFIFDMYYNLNGGNCRWDRGSSENTFSPQLDDDVDYTIIQDDNKCYINGELVATITDSSTQTNSVSLVLLARNRAGSNPFYGRIYYAKIWDNGTLVRDFVPCKVKADNAIGMYDRLTGIFYPNKGTGTFTAGPNA